MKGSCDRLGGIFVVLLSVCMMAGTLALIDVGRCPPEVGFGFITASLVPMALGHEHHRRCKAIEDRVAASKAELRMSVAAHADDVRQHVSRVVDSTHDRLGDLLAKFGKKQGGGLAQAGACDGVSNRPIGPESLAVPALSATRSRARSSGRRPKE